MIQKKSIYFFTQNQTIMKNDKIKLCLYITSIIAAVMLLISTESCVKSSMIQPIKETEITAAQQAWGVGIVSIGTAYANGGDYQKIAKDHIERFYSYDSEKVIFKPMLAEDKPFRLTSEGTLSYLIGANDSYPEDEGFALQEWKDVKWENAGIINGQGNMAIAMGNYFFTDKQGEKLKASYSIAYKRDADGKVKIVAHKSALPYKK